jgi:hypothetical protein
MWRRAAGRWPLRPKPKQAGQPVPVADVLLPERTAVAEDEAEEQSDESRDWLDRTGSGLEDVGREVGDVIGEPFDWSEGRLRFRPRCVESGRRPGGRARRS